MCSSGESQAHCLVPSDQPGREHHSGTFCSTWCQQQVLMCVVWGRVCLSPRELSGALGSCLPAERCEDSLESSVSRPRALGSPGCEEQVCSWPVSWRLQVYSYSVPVQAAPCLKRPCGDSCPERLGHYPAAFR
ncbi:uncharacterized protein AAGF69_011978 [Amazona ochrocephala]